jgi:glyoxylase-like metal-dependent hydrolase (beta-lactamase superfamily II)
MEILKSRVGGKSACGSGIIAVQQFWKKTYNIEVNDDGSQFDQLLKEGDTFKIGDVEIHVWETP